MKSVLDRLFLSFTLTRVNRTRRRQKVTHTNYTIVNTSLSELSEYGENILRICLLTYCLVYLVSPVVYVID